MARPSWLCILQKCINACHFCFFRTSVFRRLSGLPQTVCGMECVCGLSICHKNIGGTTVHVVPQPCKLVYHLNFWHTPHNSTQLSEGYTWVGGLIVSLSRTAVCFHCKKIWEGIDIYLFGKAAWRWLDIGHWTFKCIAIRHSTFDIRMSSRTIFDTRPQNV